MSMGERSPEQGVKLIRVTLILFLFLTISTTILRVIKLVKQKSWGFAEDYFIFLALGFGIATTTFIFLGVHSSQCKHMFELTFPQMEKTMMWWKLTELGYALTTICMRVSIGILLLRLFGVSRAHFYIITTCLAVTVVYGIAYCLVVVLECSPMQYFWTRFVGATEGSCMPVHTFGIITYTHSAIGVVTDCTLSTLPIFLVSKLQMNSRTKVIVSILLGIGALAAIAVIIRIPYVRILVDHATDFSYHATDVVLWTNIEPGLGVTAANIATLRPLVTRFMSRSKLFGNNTTDPADSHPSTFSTKLRSLGKSSKGFSDIESGGAATRSSVLGGVGRCQDGWQPVSSGHLCDSIQGHGTSKANIVVDVCGTKMRTESEERLRGVRRESLVKTEDSGEGGIQVTKTVEFSIEDWIDGRRWEGEELGVIGRGNVGF